jgi:hypothetical protein
MASERPSLPQFFVPGANDPEAAWNDLRSRTSGTMTQRRVCGIVFNHNGARHEATVGKQLASTRYDRKKARYGVLEQAPYAYGPVVLAIFEGTPTWMVWLDPRERTHWANPFMVGASDIQSMIDFAANYSLVDGSTGHRFGPYPRLDDALEVFRQTAPADQRHSLQLRKSNGGEGLIAESLGLSLLAYGPDRAVLWNLAGIMKDEVGLQEAMRWVAQVVSERQSAIKATDVRQRWERHQEPFRKLAERFVREPSRADAGVFAELQRLHRDREEILDLAKRLQRDPTAAKSPSVADLRKELLRVQRELSRNP